MCENANNKKMDSRMELFRNEMNRKRDAMKKALSLQIDTSFETSLDGVLKHTAHFISKVKPSAGETFKQKSVSSLGHGGKLLAVC